MSFGGFDTSGPKEAMVEINTTPLVDVMLVLLIIFIITAPLITHAVKIDLPEESSEPNPEDPKAVTLSIDHAGKLFWDSEPIDASELASYLSEAAARKPQPELHLRADRATMYERLAEVMSAAQRAGITRMGFVTLPEK